MNTHVLNATLWVYLLAGCGSTAPSQRNRPVSLAEPAGLERVAKARHLAEAWMLANQRTRGDVEYLYHPNTGQTSRNDNAIRQWITAYAMTHMALENPAILEQHRKNLDYLLSAYYRENDRNHGYILRNGKSKLGSNGLALRTLARSPLRAGNPDYQRKARLLADGILSLINEDDTFQVWYVAPASTTPARDRMLMTFYSGEALIGLLEYAELADAPEYHRVAERVQRRYISLYVDDMVENYYPAYVPWHTLSLAHLYRVTGAREWADAAFRLNDKLLEMLDRKHYVGRFYNPDTPQYGRPHASSDAVYTESLAAALGIARRAGDRVRIKRYRDALDLALPNLLSHQFQAAEPRFPGPPERYVGGLRTSIHSTWIRVDNTSHAADALRGVQEALAVPIR